MERVNRRLFLTATGGGGVLAALPEAAFGMRAHADNIIHEAAAKGADADAKPEHSIRFSVIGLDHYHIMGMTAAVQRGGGQLVSVYSTNQKALADFHERFGNVPVARGEDEILNDPAIQLVAAHLSQMSGRRWASG